MPLFVLVFQRQERLKDEVSGKRKRAEVSAKNQPVDEAEADEMRRRKRRDKELRDEIDAHNVRVRSTDASCLSAPPGSA